MQRPWIFPSCFALYLSSCFLDDDNFVLWRKCDFVTNDPFQLTSTTTWFCSSIFLIYLQTYLAQPPVSVRRWKILHQPIHGKYITFYKWCIGIVCRICRRDVPYWIENSRLLLNYSMFTLLSILRISTKTIWSNKLRHRIK